MEKIRLQVFNKESRNGMLYVEDSVESVKKLFSKFDNVKKYLYLTSKSQGLDTITRVIDPISIVGMFKNIEVRDTGELGFKEKSVIEVYADLEFMPNLASERVKECLEQNIVTIGMRCGELV